MQAYQDLAIKAAKEAGTVLLQLASKPLAYTMKSERDIQAQADLESEKIVKARIHEAFPDHAILAEESGVEERNSEYLWVIDPLDGTINYARGIEEYAVSIALCKNGEPVLGVLYQPANDCLFVAEKGKGAFMNGQKLSIAGESELANCIVATDATSKLEARRQNFALLQTVAMSVRHVRIFGSTALHIARVAQNNIDFYYKTSCNFWDVAAAIPILQEAGGVVTEIDGKPFMLDSSTILAANNTIHAKALQLLKT